MTADTKQGIIDKFIKNWQVYIVSDTTLFIQGRAFIIKEIDNNKYELVAIE